MVLCQRKVELAVQPAVHENTVSNKKISTQLQKLAILLHYLKWNCKHVPRCIEFFIQNSNMALKFSSGHCLFSLLYSHTAPSKRKTNFVKVELQTGIHYMQNLDFFHTPQTNYLRYSIL